MSDNDIENGEIQPPIDCDFWSTTKDGVEAKYKIVWTIESFNQRTEKNTESLNSDIFTIHGPGNTKTQWTIRLYPKGDSSEVSDWLSVFLCNETEAEIKAGYEFSILDSNKSVFTIAAK